MEDIRLDPLEVRGAEETKVAQGRRDAMVEVLTMDLKIVFLSWNPRLTDQYLEQLAVDNVDQVKRFERRRGRIVLRDGTEIINAYHIIDLQGWRIDQVILADDRRMEIKQHHQGLIAELLNRCQCSSVPQEFSLQIYDIDEED